jgi:hypothetical protein
MEPVQNRLDITSVEPPAATRSFLNFRQISDNCNKHLYQLEESTVAEYRSDWGYWIKFCETEVTAKTSGYMDCLVNEPVDDYILTI